MMALVLIMLGVIFCSAPLYYAFRERGVARYQKCLNNIDRLERELFPEYFTRPGARPYPRLNHPDDLDLAPGSVWLVEARDKIQLYTSPYDRSVKEADHLVQGEL
jgi:hypothetical protein